MKRELIAGLMALAVVAMACHKAEPPKASPPPEVLVTEVTQKDAPIMREWIGTTQGDVNAQIRPKVDGYLLRRVYTEGSFVHQGDLLFEVDPRQAQASLQQAEANAEQGNAGLSKAEHDVTRFEPLAAEKALSQQELDNARSAQRAARATVGSLRAAVEQARLNVAWTKVTAPISGIAGIAQAQVGDLVGPQSVLTTVSKCDPIRVVYQLSEQEYLLYQKDPNMRNAALELVLADGSVFPQKGHVLLSGRDVDVKTGTIATIGIFPNPGNILRPGQYAKVRAAVSIKHQAILVPQRAVNELQGTFQIAVVGSDNKAQVKTVKTGERVGSYWIIDEGLQPGDHVIVDGFSRVKAGQVVNPVPAPPEPGDGADADATATTGTATTPAAGAR